MTVIGNIIWPLSPRALWWLELCKSYVERGEYKCEGESRVVDINKIHCQKGWLLSWHTHGGVSPFPDAREKERVGGGPTTPRVSGLRKSNEGSIFTWAKSVHKRNTATMTIGKENQPSFFIISTCKCCFDFSIHSYRLPLIRNTLRGYSMPTISKED